MNQIQSVHNKLIKIITTLQSKKGREEQNQFLAEGIRTCQTLLDSPLQFINLYTTEKMFSEAKKIADEKYIIVVSDAVMKKLSPSTTPSGVLEEPVNPMALAITAGATFVARAYAFDIPL